MEVLQPLMLLVKEKKLRCKILLQKSVPHKFFIERKIYSEILFNIAQNAVKFNKPSGSIVICVSFNTQTKKLWTFIEDSGIGIDQNIKRNLFVAFRNQAKVSLFRMNSESSGIGIGLSNSKCLVKSLNGQISLESKLGNGTIVSYSIETKPYTQDDDDEQDKS